MHIPISRNEIATFLEVTDIDVEVLWASGALQRTLHCSSRPIEALNSSTIYDVLEYALASGDLPVILSRNLAALWVCQLAEANEWDQFSICGWEQKVMLLLDSAVVDGLAQMTRNAEKVACVVVLTQTALVNACCDVPTTGDLLATNPVFQTPSDKVLDIFGLDFMSGL